jgi:hypothetical protein
MGTTNGPYLYYCAVPRGSLHLLFLQVKRNNNLGGRPLGKPDTPLQGENNGTHSL